VVTTGQHGGLAAGSRRCGNLMLPTPRNRITGGRLPWRLAV